MTTTTMIYFVAIVGAFRIVFVLVCDGRENLTKKQGTSSKGHIAWTAAHMILEKRTEAAEPRARVYDLWKKK